MLGKQERARIYLTHIESGEKFQFSMTPEPSEVKIPKLDKGKKNNFWFAEIVVIEFLVRRNYNVNNFWFAIIKAQKI